MFFSSKKIPGLAVLSVFCVVMVVLLALLPAVELSGEVGDFQGRWFTLVSKSAGNPFFLVSVAVLSLLPLSMKLPYKMCCRLWIQFALLLVLSFGVKTLLKEVTAVPRPFTHELQQLNLVSSAEAFYQQDLAARNQMVQQASGQVSRWRTRHWQGEMNYSLPSGHTIFSAVCVMFWGGVLLRRRKYLLLTTLMFWGWNVGVSRIWLGMHWPLDLLASILAAGVLYLLVPEWRERQEIIGPHIQLT